jgi:peptidoglycan/xylan/chitin deacetylase (PgdA/CDA1 family)
VDASTSIALFDDYASYEKENNYHSTYLVTTHYYSDWLAGNFFDGYESDIKKVHDLGHDIQSHSVSHVPDFDNTAVVPMGSPGNSRASYNPNYNGAVSSNVTVFGEAEVSKDLLESIVPSRITFFRPGYLAFHAKLINVLDSLKYTYSSSHSANDVMSNFPFFSHTDLDMNGKLTNVLEIPNSISDVFMTDPMSEDNFMQKVNIWQDAFQKTYNNHLSSVLLIHPTRYYKLFAQQQFITWLPKDVIVNTLSDYGNYWRSRDQVTVSYSVNVDTMIVILSQPKNNIDPNLSFVVNNGKDLSKIKVYSSDMQVMDYISSDWESNSILLHHLCSRPDYKGYSITQTPQIGSVYVYPNPSDADHAWLHFEIMEETFVTADIFDMNGRLVNKLLSDQKFNTGSYDIPLPNQILSDGTYALKVSINGTIFRLKWLLNKTR